jgi:peptidoglycan L-alanyl-D-glutamate endopeptidase CwlK
MLNGIGKFKGVKQSLVDVITLAASRVPFDMLLTEGVRTKEQQANLYTQGRTRPGKVVTWTLNSKHITGDAVDVCPLVENKIPWDDVVLWTTMGQTILLAAKELQVEIRWGYDWDRDGVLREKGEHDGPHFELI